MATSTSCLYFKELWSTKYHSGCSGDVTFSLLLQLNSFASCKISSDMITQHYSGDQDSVVPLLGSRTLVRELAHTMGLPVTVPYSTWFRKGQVHFLLFDYVLLQLCIQISWYCVNMILKQLEVHRPWKYLCVFDFKVGGWVTEYGNFLTFATVRGASHMVPFAQPDRALGLFRSIVLGKRLPNTTNPPID